MEIFTGMKIPENRFLTRVMKMVTFPSTCKYAPWKISEDENEELKLFNYFFIFEGSHLTGKRPLVAYFLAVY